MRSAALGIDTSVSALDDDVQLDYDSDAHRVLNFRRSEACAVDGRPAVFLQ